MNQITNNRNTSDRAVATWLLVGVGMIIIQILLGGVTRLTGSGLSITEWNVVTGTLPPSSEAKWMEEFDKYRQTPQFQLLNFDFTLKDFKFIFFWEWLHRFWARLIGIVFIIPFIVFLIQRRFKPSMVKPMLILFLLGALQGAIGWIMVASGLTGDAIYVKPTRLALHFVFALGLLCYTYWFAMKLLVPEEKRVYHLKAKKQTITILVLFTIQLIYGAFMAGYKAATAAPTWPDINGHIIPPNLIHQREGLLSIVENRVTIHFIHRGLAYILLVLIIILTIRLIKNNPTQLARSITWSPVVLVVIQVILGICSAIFSTRIIPNKWGLFEWMAELHQLVAMLLLLSLTRILYYLTAKRPANTLPSI